MKLLPHGNEASHSSYADLAAEESHKVHESGECGGVGGACQSARFERLQDDAAHQSDVCACQSERQQKLHYFEVIP